ncbi:dynein beta chain, ciliary [Caerostris extrusa]|uniref:Dynein beta chain, ciliary n=1 Tax=Caerostris extrusa TaxID=172846 RepID=A0AAV4QQW3_CAEEX|nr:dynein beta chain, ciliary [Caerostris extrusa]
MIDSESEDLRVEHIRITSQQVLNYDIGHWKDIIWKKTIKLFLSTFLTYSNYYSTFKITAENYKEEILFGNVCNFPLNQYQDIFGKVITLYFVTLLITADGQMKLLKIFLVILKILEQPCHTIDVFDWDLRNIFNSITDMLSKWVPVIREVLELTPEHILAQVDQGPSSEILFLE